jgi:hypothetical protein
MLTSPTAMHESNPAIPTTRLKESFALPTIQSLATHWPAKHPGDKESKREVV